MSGGSPGRKRHKWFSKEQIKEKIANRSIDVPQYETLLFECFVEDKDGGSVFDSDHPSWKLLVKLVKQAEKEAKLKEKEREEKDSSIVTIHAPASSINTNAANNSSLSFSSSDWVDVSKILSTQEAEAFLQKELIESKQPEINKIRSFCLANGIPTEMRAEVWKFLLVYTQPVPFLQCTQELDLTNQRVIRADIERTLPKLARFQDKQVRANMELILTTYCKEQNYSYKQGMNYVLAPFFLTMNDRNLIYFCYHTFLMRFLPNTYNDEEFGGLQCLFAIFRLLVFYHDPQLGEFLDKNDMGAELYAASWFLTLHANRCVENVLLYLWDFVLLNEDCLFHYFVSLSLLLSQREKILKENPVTLPEMLSKINITTEHEVDELVKKAGFYKEQTPPSFRALFLERTQKKISIDSRDYEIIKDSSCLFVSADEIVKHVYLKNNSSSLSSSRPKDRTSFSSNNNALSPNGSSNDSIKYFLLDCRSQEQYESGHMGSAFHLDPKLVSESENLEKKVIDLLPFMTSLHFCFICNEDDEANKTQRNFLIDFFLEKNFLYVSSCQGGYEACHALVTASNGAYELVDHKRNKCFSCQGVRTNKNSTSTFQQQEGKKKSLVGRERFLSSMRERLNKITTSVSGASSSNNNTNSDNEDDEEGNVYEDTPEIRAKRANTRFQRSHLPEMCEIMPRTNHSRMLHTVLRDKHARGPAFASVVNSLISMVVAIAFEKLEMDDVDVTTISGGHVTGRACHDQVCGVTCSRVGEAALESALLPFGSVLGVVFGRMLSEERGDDESTLASGPSAVSLPADVANRLVFLCEPVISPNLQNMVSCVGELKARGVNEEKIFLLAAVAAREVLWKISESYPKVVMIVGKVDEFTAGRLVPGVARCQERYFASAAATTPSLSRTLSRSSSTDSKP